MPSLRRRSSDMRSSDVERQALARDASHFLKVPRTVHRATGVDDVVRVLRVAARTGRSVTFRSGGTSLSGQGLAEDILVEARQAFRGIEVLDGGARVRCQPGATLRAVNARLQVHGRRLGPDPASEVAATIGGVVANNSSGMTCGTELNAYRTIESAVVVLASGTVLDTGEPDADAVLLAREPAIHAALLHLRDRIRSRPHAVAEIERQFARKNTMGYSLNALLDETEPVRILTRLMVGSEGTLGFVAEAVLRTVPMRGHAATSLLLFADVDRATGCLPEIQATSPAAIELLDRTALEVAGKDPRGRRVLPSGDVGAALLVEYQELSPEDLVETLSRGALTLGALPLLRPAEVSRDPRSRADLWHVRKGLYASVAGARPSGTTALLEDIAVPVHNLAATCRTLGALMSLHGYEGNVVFGHAKDGNLHFLISEDFSRAEGVRRFSAFTEDVVAAVLGVGGTLKAEHGTGRMMAPFVRRQYGDELYEVMCEVKAVFDPAGILNPGAVISDDPTIHLRHLKTSPTVEQEVDRCVDCGYCEPACPSKDLTLTPRQRIGLRRERARAEQAGEDARVRELDAATRYSVVDTCAVDGMCATACPVGIDTGTLVKRLRAEAAASTQKRAWSTAAKNWGRTTTTASMALAAAKRRPRLAAAVSRAARWVAGTDTVPLWDSGLPAGGTRREPRPAVNPAAVFMPACVGSMFGPEPGYPGVTAALLALCDRAGVAVTVPEGIADTCCGTPFASKGMTTAHGQMRERMEAWLWQATDRARLPVVVDASSCTEGLTSLLDRFEATYGRPITVIDAITFTSDSILPALPQAPRRLTSLAVHPTCSTTRLGLTPTLLTLAGTVADRVEVPVDWGCCGFAGDRGLLHPELTASASARQGAEIRELHAAAHASANRTCEIGMTRATGRAYVHVLEHLAIAQALVPAPLSIEPDKEPS
ncbi:MAG TPA: FAD-binding oxidoreductase [Actinobacteria bacterium]|nr:FAD-binding oxidoreductase [Actinomycetota bacterium]